MWKKYENNCDTALLNKARHTTSNANLELICQQMDIADNIYLGKVDLWLAKSALSEIYKLLIRFPYMREYMDYFGTWHGFVENKKNILTKFLQMYGKDEIKNFNDCYNESAKNMLEALKHNALAIAFKLVYGDFIYSGIMINGSAFIEKDVIMNLYYGEQSGHSPIGCNSVKSVIDHEFGHLIDYMLNINGSYEFKLLMNQYDESFVKKNLSLYCVSDNKKNNEEIVAEAFSEYCNNKKPREIAVIVGLIIYKKYREFVSDKGKNQTK